MAYKRAAALGERPDDTALTRDMADIGMNFGRGSNQGSTYVLVLGVIVAFRTVFVGLGS